jgi:ADP-heptose:LPS heptosyltransferase
MHAVDRYWLVAESLGAATGPKEFHVPISEAARRWAINEVGSYPRPWLVFGVGARWVTKRWPPSHFAVLAERAQRRCGGTAILVGAGDDTSLAHAVAEKLAGPCLDLTGKTDLQQLPALLCLADVMVANDTGPLHVAAALGRPVVAPYTCTRVVLTGPYGAASSAVQTAVWCSGSCIKRCPRLDCMTELTPDRLWPVLEGHLRTWESNRRSA